LLNVLISNQYGHFVKLAILASFFILVLLLGACSSHTPLSVPSSLSKNELIEPLAFYPQTSDQCGPESLATLLSSTGHEILPSELSPFVYLPQRGGSLAIELKAQARQQGVLVYPVVGINDLLLQIAAGYPVLVMQNLGFSWYPRWHFAVVIGYDLETQQVILRSGDQPRYFMPLSLFRQTWKRAAYWAMIVLTPPQLPAQVDASRYLQGAADLEETGQLKTALDAYKQAVSTWPNKPLAWFGLGNTAYSQGDYARSRSAYLQLLKLVPDHLGAWNNLAFTYQALKCQPQAEVSISCALLLAPNNKELRQSQQELTQAISKNSGTNNSTNNIKNSICDLPPACPSS
jgi:hypothetical protein